MRSDRIPRSAIAGIATWGRPRVARTILVSSYFATHRVEFIASARDDVTLLSIAEDAGDVVDPDSQAEDDENHADTQPEKPAAVVEHMLTKEDGEKFSTRDQIVGLHTQVNAIETQLRDMKHIKLQSLVADLEERVFGETCA